MSDSSKLIVAIPVAQLQNNRWDVVTREVRKLISMVGCPCHLDKYNLVIKLEKKSNAK